MFNQIRLLKVKNILTSQSFRLIDFLFYIFYTIFGKNQINLNIFRENMTDNQWKIFCDFKYDLKKMVVKWNEQSPNLVDLQKHAAKIAKTPDYPFETPIVYNLALEEISKNDEIKLIVIGDNPGKDEQLARNNKYLVGQAGKIAEGFFKRNESLGIDFRKNVIILNKTPIHSAKTSQLKTIAKSGGEKISELIKESQIWMAKRTAQLHIELNRQTSDENKTELWLVGYSELKDKGLFLHYRDELKKSYFIDEISKSEWQNVLVFQHFSMNRFTIDLKNFMEKNCINCEIDRKILRELGKIHRNEIFGD